MNINTNLNINIGKDEYGKDLIINISNIKNLLIAGNTGSGKSVLLHKIISTLISNNFPGVLKFIMVDTKQVELGIYDKIPHLMTPVISDAKKSILAMKWATSEIKRRLETLKENNCRDINQYRNEILIPEIEKYKRLSPGIKEEFNLPESMPHIVIIIDEICGLMSTYPRETESMISNITQMGHIVGVSMIISTNRPNKQVLVKTILDSIGTRIALQTSSPQDSKLIMGMPDACKLNGSGDMIFREGLKYPIHAQVDMVDFDVIKKIVKDLEKKYEDGNEFLNVINLRSVSDKPSKDTVFSANFDDIFEDDNDDLYEQAKEIVITSGRASTSLLQRKMGIGYSRAAKILDILEEKGIVGPANGSLMRKVYGENSKK